MGVIKKTETERMVSSLRLAVSHFARGTFPITASSSVLPVNRVLTVLENPDGKINYLADQSAHHVLKNGHLYFIPVYHPCHISLNTNLHFISIQFRLEPYTGVDLFSNYSDILAFAELDLARRVKACYDMSPELGSSLQLGALTYEIAGHCLERMAPGELGTIARFGLYRKLIDYITLNCSAKMHVGDMARVMKLGRETFTRRFTEDTGISPKRFFNRYLLRRACDLLCRPHTTVRETAYALTFSSEYYFSRFFRRNTGMTPRQFQQSQRLI